MPKITVNRSGGGGAKWRVLVDDDHHYLNFKGDSAVLDVAAGPHALVWVLIGGQPGAEFEIGIDDPANAKFTRKGHLDDDGDGAGQGGFAL